MEDLLQSQIQDSCRLALPNGLKELMSDISREVLRAQPKNLLKFITDYLSTLLVTRENLYIAAQVCNAVCTCDCRPELEDELRLSGLDETLVNDVTEIINKHIEEGEVNEGNLLVKLISKTSIDESHLPAILAAVQKAFLFHQRNHTKIYESSSSSGDNESERAVRHTLGLYRKVAPSLETYNNMAQKIQAAYRAYRVRRESDTAKKIKSDQLTTTPSLSESNASFQEEGTPEVKSEILEKIKVTFGSIESSTSRSLDTCSDQSKTDAAPIRKLSPTSLEGSYSNLPKYRAFSAHDFVTLEETPEKERSNYDYTRENIPVDEQNYVNKNIKDNDHKYKNILFELPDEDFSDESESIEETGLRDADDVSTVTEEELEAREDVDVIEEYTFELHLEPTTDVEKSESVLKPNDVDKTTAAGIITEENVNSQDIVEEIHSMEPDKVYENIEEVGIMSEENVNSQDIVEKVHSINPDEVYENIEEKGIMTEENVNSQDIVEEIHSMEPDEVYENIEEVGIMSEENVNSQDIVEEVHSINPDEVYENIEEVAGIMNEENVNLDTVEENIVIDEIGDITDDDIPKDINGSY